VSGLSPKGACAVGVWCLDSRRRARAQLVSGVWTDAEGRVRCWCLVSGRSPKGACAVGVWCLDGRCPVGVWCLVSGGCFSLVRPLFWGELQMAKMQHGVLWEAARWSPSLSDSENCRCAGLLLGGGPAAEPRLNGGRPPHGDEKAVPFLPKIGLYLEKFYRKFFSWGQFPTINPDRPELVHIDCTQPYVSQGDSTECIS